MSRKDYYVYIHTNPENGKPFYVGKGTGNRAHAISGRASIWYEFVYNYLHSQGLTFGVSIEYTNLTEKEALIKEIQILDAYTEAGYDLFNYAKTKDIQEIRLNMLTSMAPLLNPLKILSRFVKRKRKETHMTQKKLAESAGVGLRFVRELEQKNLHLD